MVILGREDSWSDEECFWQTLRSFWGTTKASAEDSGWVQMETVKPNKNKRKIKENCFGTLKTNCDILMWAFMDMSTSSGSNSKQSIVGQLRQGMPVPSSTWCWGNWTVRCHCCSRVDWWPCRFKPQVTDAMTNETECLLQREAEALQESVQITCSATLRNCF